MKHGNGMDKARSVTITYSADRGRIRLSIEDEGAGFDLRCCTYGG